jgi:hypothetical protein
MKTIIAGSRTINDYGLVERAIEMSGWADEITEVVCGDAKGADYFGEIWAKKHNVVVKHFPADWKNVAAPNAVVRENAYGKYNARAGVDRNCEMARYADNLIAIIENNSRGTAHMIETASSLGRPVCVYEV